MSHYTGLSKLQNHPHRSGFDISSKNCFTAKCGELLPVYWDLGIPNCTYDINLQYFTRTRPVQTAAYTRVREYFDFYAVPLDLIWKSFDTSVIQMGEVAPVQSKDLLNSLIVQGDLPYCSLYDISNALLYQNGNVATGGSVSVTSGYESIHGFNRADLSHKLLHMLDYGNVVAFDSTVVGTTVNRFWNRSVPLPSSLSGTYSQKYRQNLIVNIFPLAAYQKIYQDFFRWSQWENADPTSYNFDWYSGSGSIFSGGLSSAIPAANDYWKRDNLFSLRYCNWNKDKFMGLLPNSQFGDVALVNFGEDGSGLLPVGLVSDQDQFTQIYNSTVLNTPSDTSGISSDNIPISQSKRSDKYLLPSSVANQPATFRASSGEALLSSTLAITDSSIFIIYFFCIFIITPHHNKSMSTFQTIKLIHITGNHIIKDSISLRRAFIACV